MEHLRFAAERGKSIALPSVDERTGERALANCEYVSDAESCNQIQLILTPANPSPVAR